MRCKAGAVHIMALFAALVALPAFAVSAAESGQASRGSAQALPSGNRADVAARDGAGSRDVADSHLRLQFVLHRTSRYLYNSTGVISLATSADQTVPLEH